MTSHQAEGSNQSAEIQKQYIKYIGNLFLLFSTHSTESLDNNRNYLYILKQL